MCGGFAVQQGTPLNDFILSKMSKEERRFWENFLEEVKQVIDQENAKKVIDKEPKKVSNTILVPPISLKLKYEEAITKYDGKRYCQVRQLEEIFVF